MPAITRLPRPAALASASGPAEQRGAVEWGPGTCFLVPFGRDGAFALGTPGGTPVDHHSIEGYPAHQSAGSAIEPEVEQMHAPGERGAQRC